MTDKEKQIEEQEIAYFAKHNAAVRKQAEKELEKEERE